MDVSPSLVAFKRIGGYGMHLRDIIVQILHNSAMETQMVIEFLFAKCNITVVEFHRINAPQRAHTNAVGPNSRKNEGILNSD